MTGPEKPPLGTASVTTDPAEATGLQTGVGKILVDHELGTGQTVKIPQPKRRRPLKGVRPDS